MRVFTCIDDTDSLKSKGTGKLASALANDLEKNGWGKSYFVSRHQLFVHPDIPYTSHNSSMCFAADMDQANFNRFIDYASSFLENQSAPGSDPGLCIAPVENPASLSGIINFGLKAKRQVLTKDEAYNLASHHGIHLSEHGGTGGGVIGALAGVGLRLTGNDGRVRGKLVIGCHYVAARASTIKSHKRVDEVRSICGKIPRDDEFIWLGFKKTKTVLLEGKSVMLVLPVDPPVAGFRWRTYSKPELERDLQSF